MINTNNSVDSQLFMVYEDLFDEGILDLLKGNSRQDTEALLH